MRRAHGVGQESARKASPWAGRSSRGSAGGHSAHHGTLDVRSPCACGKEGTLALPEGFRITTAMLWQGALVLALADLALLLLITRLVDTAAFQKLAPLLPTATAMAWALLWLWAVTFFWDTVYAFVFPSWSRWFLPGGQALLTGAIAWAAVRAAVRLPGRAVVWYCLLGGFWGVVTHTLAVSGGIVSEPPPLQGASPGAAVGIAFFEFTFYWCVIVLGSLTVVRAAAAPRRRRTS
jgi:hypothetical protein